SPHPPGSPVARTPAVRPADPGGGLSNRGGRRGGGGRDRRGRVLAPDAPGPGVPGRELPNPPHGRDHPPRPAPPLGSVRRRGRHDAVRPDREPPAELGLGRDGAGVGSGDRLPDVQHRDRLSARGAVRSRGRRTRGAYRGPNPAPTVAGPARGGAAGGGGSP